MLAPCTHPYLDPLGLRASQGTPVCTEPVTEYSKVLATTLSSHALSITTHYIRDIFKCSVQIPASLTMAIYHRQFRWPAMSGARRAFRIFSLHLWACFSVRRRTHSVGTGGDQGQRHLGRLRCNQVQHPTLFHLEPAAPPGLPH
jgi:hypothetical protein